MNRWAVWVLVFLVPLPVAGNEPVGWRDLEVTSSDRSVPDEELVTDVVKSLDGHPVRLRGYLVPSSVFQTDDIKRFVLLAEVKSTDPAAKSWRSLPMHMAVQVEMTGESGIKFVTKPLRVEGNLSIDVVRNSKGDVVMLYKVRAQRVLTVPRRPGYRRLVLRDGC